MTVDPDRFVTTLQQQGIPFVAGVPDSLLAGLSAAFAQRLSPSEHVIAANEGAALALCAGYHLATGRVAATYLQNAGLGNLVNPLLSLVDAEVYGIPVVVIVGWRGEPGRPDEPQHLKQGRVTIPLLDTMGYPHRVLGESDAEAAEDVAWAVATATRESTPTFLVVRKGTFGAAPAAPVDEGLAREDALEAVLDALDPDTLFVATTGMIGRELFELRERRGESHDRDFLTVGSMGHASAIALGVALGRPDRCVVCLDGDGAMLMHLGSVAVAGQVAPSSFAHVLVNNGAHDSVGGQPTVAFGVDLTAVARACGYRTLGTVRTRDEIGPAAAQLFDPPGPALLEIRVGRGARADLGRPTIDPADARAAFRAALGERVGDPAGGGAQ